MKVCDTIQMLESEKSRKLMAALYGETAVESCKKFSEKICGRRHNPVQFSGAHGNQR